MDINGLAIVAVIGDERALYLFSSWRPKRGNDHQTKIGKLTYLGGLLPLYFVLADDGVVFPDSTAITHDFVKLLAMSVPNCYLLPNVNYSHDTFNEKKMLRRMQINSKMCSKTIL